MDDDLKEAAKQVEVCVLSFLSLKSNRFVLFFFSESAKLTVGWDEIQDGGFAEY